MRRLIWILSILLALVPVFAAVAGMMLGPGILHPMNLNPDRLPQMAEMLERTTAKKKDFEVRAPDGVALRGWKVRPAKATGDWVLLYHGVSDNRTGILGAAEFLLRHSFSLVMMDARAHGKSGGEIATYGWKERFDTRSLKLSSQPNACGIYTPSALRWAARLPSNRRRSNQGSRRWLPKLRSPASSKSPMTTQVLISARCWGRRCFGLPRFLRCARQPNLAGSTRTTFLRRKPWLSVPSLCS